MLTIENLEAKFEEKPILKGVSLTIGKGELHVIYGPNGSGKSTLGKVLLRHPAYQQIGGKILFEGQDIDQLETAERARLGIFLSHQSPPAVIGVSAEDMLRAAEKAKSEGRQQKVRNVLAFKRDFKTNLSRVRLPEEFMKRSMHEGASGGERKKMEIAALLTLDAKLAFLDEIDSGLDFDSLKSIVEGVHEFMEQGERSIILVTHSEKMVDMLNANHIHVFYDGRIVHSGGRELAQEILQKGFDVYAPQS
jgi:Fe-S cluster assembly ATP-binding protein